MAAVRAIGEPEDALFWAKHEAKEARIDLDEYEKGQRRQARRATQEFVNAEKWEQIGGAIAENNALYIPGDPEYIALTVEGYTKLHSRWKLQ
eukprot:5481509-Prymnesium_polylepis.1